MILIIISISIYLSKTKEGFENKKIAFYTCFYGTDDNNAFKIPELPSEKYDCFYFSNNRNILNQIKNTKWKGIFDDQPVTDDIVESCFYGKKVKVLPESFVVLNNYAYTCFMDSKIDKLSESFIETYIDKYFIQNNYALLVREHHFMKDTIWNDFNESMKQQRYYDKKENYFYYITEQLKKGFYAETNDYCQCNVLIRNMNHPKIKEINSNWYSEIKKCGIQDQISFFFVKQMFNEHIKPFSESPFLHYNPDSVYI